MALRVVSNGTLGGNDGNLVTSVNRIDLSAIPLLEPKLFHLRCVSKGTDNLKLSLLSDKIELSLDNITWYTSAQTIPQQTVRGSNIPFYLRQRSDASSGADLQDTIFKSEALYNQPLVSLASLTAGNGTVTISENNAVTINTLGATTDAGVVYVTESLDNKNLVYRVRVRSNKPATSIFRKLLTVVQSNVGTGVVGSSAVVTAASMFDVSINERVVGDTNYGVGIGYFIADNKYYGWDGSSYVYPAPLVNRLDTIPWGQPFDVFLTVTPTHYQATIKDIAGQTLLAPPAVAKSIIRPLTSGYSSYLQGGDPYTNTFNQEYYWDEFEVL